MGFYRKKPVVIEAVQYFANGHSPFSNEVAEAAPWIDEAYESGALENNYVRGIPEDKREHRLAIKTLEGAMFAQPGDWIVRGVKGEIYACKPEIFALTYEEVDQ